MNRRNFLRGVGGVVVGLPFLETFARRTANAQAAAPVKRFVVFFECNGVNMQKFFPATPFGPLTAASFTGRALEPLAPYANRMLIPRGMHMSPMGFGQDPIPGCDHHKGMGCKLTAANLANDGDNYAQGISVDQAIAAAVNPGGAQALTLMVGPTSRGVLGTISYSGPGRPVTARNNPWTAYQDLMGMSSGGTMPDPMVMDRIVRRRQSVIDLVSEEFRALQNSGLSRGDRAKLDMHFNTIREVEMGMMGTGMVACTLPTATVDELRNLNPSTIATDAEFKHVGQLQMKVLALALACGNNRVATLQWGTGSGGPIFRWDGMNHMYNHHKLSHGNTADDSSGAEVAGYLDMIFEIDKWFATQYAFLLGLLDGYHEANGTVLENSAVVWMNELSDGKAHDFRDLPIVIAGSCAGYFRQGQYIKVTSRADNNPLGGWWDNSLDAPHNKLLTTFMNAMGVRATGGGPVTNFGMFGQPGEFNQIKA